MQKSKLSLGLTTIAVGLACAGCSGALDPQGAESQRIYDLSWLMYGLASAILVLVLALLAWALFRRRRGPGPFSRRPGLGLGFILGGGVVLPLVVLSVLLGFTIRTLAASRQPQPGSLTIQVVGHEWWWEVRYPDQGFTTANEIHIPVGEDVNFQVSTIDVIHSFWVPNLAGKIDMIPGQTNEIVLHARKAGTYRGQCAEYCGLEHANMAFYVVAQDRSAFESWVRSQQAPEAQNSAAGQRGLDVFTSQACVSCHRVRGTPASADVGPDLTHLASRSTIGAGTAPTKSQNLAAWIRDPSQIKSGVHMPAFPNLSDQEVQDLVAFLLEK